MRSMFTRFLGVAVVLSAASLWAVAAQDAATVEAINKLADDATKKEWNELAKAGEPLAKKHDLSDVMNLFKLRKPGEKVSGVGVGNTPGAIKPDGIEAKIMNIMRNPMAPATLDKEQADLIRLAERTAAIAAVTVHQCTVEKKMGQKDPAQWKQWMEEMHKESVNLTKALKAKKPIEVRDTAKKLYATCTECHGVFRDS